MPATKKTSVLKPRKTTTKAKAKKVATPVKSVLLVEKEQGLTVSVVGVDGKAKGKMTLPKELFGGKVNKQLLAQAVRVYLANQRVGGASTKTRGEVEGSTRKIYRQKGTGRARHGGIRAPIFVGGGIVFGPKPKDFHLQMPSKMKKAALASALVSQLTAGNIIIVDGLEALAPKTKIFADVLHKIGVGKKTLLIVPKDAENIVRATRNLGNVENIPFQNLHTYAVLAHDKIIFTKNTLRVRSSRLAG